MSPPSFILCSYTTKTKSIYFSLTKEARGLSLQAEDVFDEGGEEVEGPLEDDVRPLVFGSGPALQVLCPPDAEHWALEPTVVKERDLLALGF